MSLPMISRKGATRALALAIAVFALPAAAAETQVEYAKETVLDFEDDTIQGDLTRPDGEFVDARQRVSHTNLIRVRKNFRDKVLESVGEL